MVAISIVLFFNFAIVLRYDSTVNGEFHSALPRAIIFRTTSDIN